MSRKVLHARFKLQHYIQGTTLCSFCLFLFLIFSSFSYFLSCGTLGKGDVSKTGLGWSSPSYDGLSRQESESSSDDGGGNHGIDPKSASDISQAAHAARTRTAVEGRKVAETVWIKSVNA